MRKVLCVLLLSAFAFAGDKMPLPQKLLSAKTVYIDNRSGDAKFADAVYSELKKSGRFQIAQASSGADVILRLREDMVTLHSGTSRTNGTLEVIDPATGDILYTESRDIDKVGHQREKVVRDLLKRMQ